MQLPLQINEKLGGVLIRGTFEHRVCHFVDDSGAGKTYLFALMQVYCTDKQLKCVSLNYNQIGQPAQVLCQLCIQVDIVLLDNADLYDYKALVKWLHANTNSLVLMSHHEMVLPSDGEAFYSVKYANATMQFKVDD